MDEALIVIDYTRDFVADNGALTCGKPGQAIEQAISAQAQSFIEKGSFVVFAVDLHHELDIYHPETKLYPPHNIAGTEGRRLFGDVEAVYEKNKSKSNVYWMDKTRYSAFAGTDLELQLNSRGIKRITLSGVCTDICIIHTAIDAYNKGYTIEVDSKTVASFNHAGHEWALLHLKNSLHATVI